MVRDINFNPGEEIATQHIKLVDDMKKSFIIQPRKLYKGKLHTWKLNDRDVVNNFKEKLNNLLESEKNLNLESVEDR